jgi:hypothetical protein
MPSLGMAVFRATDSLPKSMTGGNPQYARVGYPSVLSGELDVANQSQYGLHVPLVSFSACPVLEVRLLSRLLHQSRQLVSTSPTVGLLCLYNHQK